MDFVVKRDDLRECEVADTPTPQLEPGQARLDVSAFGLTANNITYAVFGDAMSYWDFFPAEDGWGRIPVWGFADVAASEHDELEEGVRVYGYLPPSTHLVVNPKRVDAHGFVDGTAHRSKLPSAYNGYARTDGDPLYDAGHEDEQILLRPLFFTSFLIDDFLDDSDFFGADTTVISSASSKTASAAAFLLQRREGIDVVGLTSPGNADFVEGLGVYDRVVTYEDLDSLPGGASVYLDISGNPAVTAGVHQRYGDELKHSAVVGDSHWDSTEGGGGDLPGPSPTFFFAPDRVAKRSGDWGREGLEGRVAEAWRPYVEWTGGWLRVEHGSGPEALEAAYRELLDGRVDPARAHVLSLAP